MVHTIIYIGALALAVIFSPTSSRAQASSDPHTTCVAAGAGNEALCLGDMSRGALKDPNAKPPQKRFDDDDRPVSPWLYR
jgi:hypothetical protein